MAPTNRARETQFKTTVLNLIYSAARSAQRRVGWCRVVLNSVGSPNHARQPLDKKAALNYRNCMPVYLIRHIPSRRIKIGRAKDVWARLRGLKIAWPVLEEFEVLGIVPSKYGDAVEEVTAHKAYADLRVHGEWFKEEGDLADFVKTLGPPTPIAEMCEVEPHFWQKVTNPELALALGGLSSKEFGIAVAYRRGKKLKEIAKERGCSRQRIHQILVRCRDKVLLHRRSRA